MTVAAAAGAVASLYSPIMRCHTDTDVCAHLNSTTHTSISLLVARSSSPVVSSHISSRKVLVTLSISTINEVKCLRNVLRCTWKYLRFFVIRYKSKYHRNYFVGNVTRHFSFATKQHRRRPCRQRSDSFWRHVMNYYKVVATVTSLCLLLLCVVFTALSNSSTHHTLMPPVWSGKLSKLTLVTQMYWCSRPQYSVCVLAGLCAHTWTYIQYSKHLRLLTFSRVECKKYLEMQRCISKYFLHSL